MPIYDFLCPDCEQKKEDVFVHSWDEEVKCKQCRVPMKRLISTGIVGKCFPAEGVFLKHVSPQGHRFHSEREMRQYEKDNNVSLGYLGHA